MTYALDGRALDYLVVQHMEPDHCSLIDEMLRRYPEAKIVCSAKALSMLAQFYGLDAKDRALVVAEGDKLSTGPAYAAFHHGAHGPLAGGNGHL